MPLELNVGQPVSTLPLKVDRAGLRDAAGLEIAQSNQFNRGWQSAGMNEDASTLMWKANRAEVDGDPQAAAVFEQQGHFRIPDKICAWVGSLTFSRR